MNRIYWIIFLSPLIIRMIQIGMDDKNIISQDKQKGDKALVTLVFGIIIFFSGLRTFVADTAEYVMSYEFLPFNIAEFDRSIYSRDWMFYFLSCCFKSITRASYQLWLFVIALISGIAFAKGVYKYSKYKWLTCYLFISGALFTYFFNGMRQFIAMSILFCNTDLLFEGNNKKFITLVAALGLIHGSAWVFLPSIFLFKIKPWSKWIFGGIILSIIIGVSFNSLAGILDAALQNTQYAGMGQTLADGVGSKNIRVLIAAVPVILAFCERKLIEQENDKTLNFYVNCSVMYMSLMIISTFSFGIYMGRVAAYYEMFNLILLPRLMYDFLEKKTSVIIISVCMLMYFIYFYYQMEVVWHLPYTSKILRIVQAYKSGIHI